MIGVIEEPLGFYSFPSEAMPLDPVTAPTIGPHALAGDGDRNPGHGDRLQISIEGLQDGTLTMRLNSRTWIKAV